MAYGHSWAGGAGASSPGAGFVARAAHRLGYTVDNRAVGGSSALATAELVRREQVPPARWYVLMTGLNDARLYGPGVSRRPFVGAVAAILDAFRAASPSASTVLLQQPVLLDYTGFPPHDKGSDDVVAAYNDVLRALVGHRPGSCLATVDPWDAHTMLDEDGVHPNDHGHVALAAALVRAIHGTEGP